MIGIILCSDVWSQSPIMLNFNLYNLIFQSVNCHFDLWQKAS